MDVPKQAAFCGVLRFISAGNVRFTVERLANSIRRIRTGLSAGIVFLFSLDFGVTRQYVSLIQHGATISIGMHSARQNVNLSIFTTAKQLGSNTVRGIAVSQPIPLLLDRRKQILAS